jgi:hypothetical protein
LLALGLEVADADAEALALVDGETVELADDVTLIVLALAAGVLEDEKAWVLSTRVSTAPTRTTPPIGP